MDLNLPSELRRTPLALVALSGLDPDSCPAHADLWRRFSAGSSSAAALGDRQTPLRFILANDLSVFPPMKPKRNSYEWFIPKGVLKKNWMRKHLDLLPAVVVVMADLDWGDPNFNDKMADCARRVADVRAALSGRGTKIAMVLIQRETPQPVASDDVTASERASALCSACEVSNRSLFVLPAGAQNLDGYVVRLEGAFHELAQNYYHQEIRSVKSHRDYLNKTTHLYLFVRHQFKVGFLNELKRDYHAAYKHYGQAYSLLMEVRATDTNIMEVKTVAGFISYKICRLAFKVNLPRDAISQFRKHMDIFQQKVGMDVLAFEHKGWQSKQSEFFADVFAEAVDNGQQAIQTQHPGLYYQQAAQHAIARREIAEEQVAAEPASGADYPSPDPLQNADGLEFFGQRPWRPGKVSLEPPDMEYETVGIQALLHHERHNVDHSTHIIGLLQRAIAQFRNFRSPRSESHLTVNMAEELKSARRYGEALDLLRPVLRHYRAEAWRPLLDAVLALGVKCAFLLGDAAGYAALALDLCSPESSVSSAEKARVAGNVSRILDGKVPAAEPGLTSKADRAAVGEAAAKWSALLREKQDAPLVVDMTGRGTAVRATARFASPCFKADQKAKVEVKIANHLLLTATTKKEEGSDEENTLLLRGVKVRLSSPKHKLEWEGSEEVAAGSAVRRDFEFGPDAADVGSSLMVVGTSVVVGRDFRMELDCAVEEDGDPLRRHFIAPKVSSGEEEEDAFEEVSLGRPTAEVAQREPLMVMSLEHRMPALVGEWFAVDVVLKNGEREDDARDVEVSAVLADAFDPIIADTTALAFDPAEAVSRRDSVATAPTTPSGEDAARSMAATEPLKKSLGTVSRGQETKCRLYVRSSTIGRRGVQVRVTYSVRTSGDGLECRSSLSEFLDLQTSESFSLESSLLSARQRPVQQAHTDEPFVLAPKLRALTVHDVTILDSWAELRAPVKRRSEGKHRSHLAGCCMGEGSEARDWYPLVVRRADLLPSSLDVHELTMGKLMVRWTRGEHDGDLDVGKVDPSAVTTTAFDLPSCRVRLSGLHASALLPSHGVVRTPLTLTYVLRNRTDRVMEFALTVEPSEAFMLSGNKQLQLRLLPGASKERRLTYVLYPLVAGEAVALPRLRLAPARINQSSQDPESVLERTLPKTIAILPKARGGGDDVALTAAGIDKNEEGSNFKLGEAVVLENPAYARAVRA